jgi:hypothetical protein
LEFLGSLRYISKPIGGFMKFIVMTGFMILMSVSSCTQEVQNKISRSIQNWTGTNGVLDVISNGQVMYRFIQIDKLSTARATGDSGVARPYRFGYGVLDKNQNFKREATEKKIYFEVSDYSTQYVFYENPDR